MDENNKKLKREITTEKLKIVLSSIAMAILLIMELYVMINYKSNFIAMGLGILLIIVALFFLINSLIEVSAKNKEIDQNKYDEIYNAQKASYIVIRKSFDEMEARLKNIEENSALPAEDIINAQKAVAKVTISRSKENTDALMNSNDELINQLLGIQDSLNNSNENLMQKQQEMLNETKNDLQSQIESLNKKLNEINKKLKEGVVTKTVVETGNINTDIGSEKEESDSFNLPEMEASITDETEDELDIDSIASEEISELDIDADSSNIEEPNEPEEDITDIDSSSELDIEGEALEETEDDMPSMEAELEESEELSMDSLEDNIEEQEELISEEPVAEEGVSASEQEVATEPEEEVATEEVAIEEEQDNEPAAEENIEEVATEEATPEATQETSSDVPTVNNKPIGEGLGIDLSDPNRVMSPEEIEKLFASL